jgi:4'-phosphopantetheinyl transferase
MHSSFHNTFSISDPAIHLYIGCFEEIDTPAIREACAVTLCSVEWQRIAKFAFAGHRRQYLLAHGLVRRALSRHVGGVDPAAWQFCADRYGRSFIVAPKVASPLHFSLSHTEGCVACVISSSEHVGIDVEAVDRSGQHLALAESVLSLEEVASLRALPAIEQTERFFDYWTLKEAYIKARGMGLHLPLDRFTMRFEPNRQIGIVFDPEFGDDPKRWRFMSTSPSPSIRLAVADGSGEPGGLPILIHPWPLP